MATIHFQNDAISAKAPPETWLVDLCDEVGATVPFNCRVGKCGRCVVTVEEGAGLLAPPETGELETLAAKAAAPGQRLCCQAVVKAEGTISLRWADLTADSGRAESVLPMGRSVGSKG